jgi:hypothetical protein
LKREQNSAPAFFRATGPVWSDFEAGYHPFLDETAASVGTALEKYRFHAVEGEFAEWREQFVRFLGWHFSTKNIPVFFSDVREWTPTDQIDLSWEQFDSPPAIILLENVHYHPDMVRDFLYQAEAHSKRLKVIVSFEPAIETLLERRPYSDDLFTSMPHTPIDGQKIAQTLVERYSQVILHRSVGTRVISAFLEFGWTDLPESGFFYRYGSDRTVVNLWRLGAFLRNWDGKGLPDTEDKEARTSFGIDETIASIASSNIPLASLLATVAFFSQYEAALPRAFLTERLNYKPETVIAALERGLVRTIETGLILDLPGMSNTILGSIARNKEVELDVARRLGSTTEIGTTLVITAIEYGIYDYGALILNLSAQPSPAWTIRKERILDAVTKLITIDMSPGRIGRALVALRSVKDSKNAEEDLDSKVQEMPTRSLNSILSSIKPRIAEFLSTEIPLKETAWFIVGLSEIERGAAADGVAEVPIAATTERIVREDDLAKVGSFLWAVERANHGVANRLVKALDRQKTRSRIDAERSPAKIGWFFEVIAAISPEISAEIIQSLSTSSLRKFDKNTATDDLTSLMWGLSRAKIDVARDVFSVLEFSELEARVREEQRAYGLGLLLLALSDANPTLATKLVDAIGADVFEDRLSSEHDPAKRGLLIGALAAVHSSTSKSLVRSDAGHLGSMIDFFGRQEIMFSRRCAPCMAAARAHRLDSVELAEAAGYFALARDRIPGHANLTRLLLVERYEPDLLARTVRNALWDATIHLIGTADAADKSKIARILYNADAERFRSWVVLSTKTSKDAYPLLAWSYLEPEGARDYIRSNWHAAVKLYIKTKDIYAKSSLAVLLKDADSVSFIHWLREIRANPQHNPFPKELLSSLDSIDLTAEIAAWIRTRTQIDRRAAIDFFRIAKSSDLNIIFSKIRTNKRMIRSLIRLSQGENGKIRTNISTIIDAAIFLEIVLSDHPQGYSHVSVADRTIANLVQSPDLISEVLPCGSTFDDREYRTKVALPKEIYEVLKGLQFFSSLRTVDINSYDLKECFVRLLSAWDQGVGSEFAHALGRERIFALLRKWKGAILARAIDRAMPEEGAQLRELLMESFLENPASTMGELYELSRATSPLPRDILDKFSDQALADELTKRNTDEISDALSYLYKILPERARNVFRIMGSSWLSAKMESEGNIRSLDRALTELEEIDATRAADASSHISAKALEVALQREDMWPDDTVARLARAAPQLVIDAFDKDVLEKFYQANTSTSLVGPSAADFLKRLRTANIDVWSAIMRKLDIGRIADLINATNKEPDVLFGNYDYRFFEELARFDVRTLVRLHELAPKTIQPDTLKDFEADFPISE